MKKAIRNPWVLRLLIVSLSGMAALARDSGGLPAGTRIQVRLLNQLDTGQAQAGQAFSATVAAPVVAGGRVMLPTGARVNGEVTEAVSSGRLKRPASITLELTRAGGRSFSTEPLRLDGKSHLLRNVGIIGGETAAGAIIGGAAGGKEGAAIGAAIGAGAGTATAYMTGKKEIVLPVETPLTFVVAGSESGGVATTAYRVDPPAPRASRQRSAGGEREEDEESTYFSERDRRVILRYYAMNTSNLPPGLAKRGGHLPPGLEKHLERDGTLPPGLQRRVEPFPDELEAHLPRLPGGYSRVILSGRAMIVGPYNRIVDVIFIRQVRNNQDEDEDRDED